MIICLQTQQKAYVQRRYRQWHAFYVAIHLEQLICRLCPKIPQYRHQKASKQPMRSYSPNRYRVYFVVLSTCTTFAST